MIGDGGKHEQSTVTWYDVVKFVGEFRNGKMEKNFVKESTLLEFFAPLTMRFLILIIPYILISLKPTKTNPITSCE